jgi:hypothetical protein
MAIAGAPSPRMYFQETRERTVSYETQWRLYASGRLDLVVVCVRKPVLLGARVRDTANTRRTYGKVA